MSVVLHHGTCFLLCEAAGDIDDTSADGLYFEDVRCLSTWQQLTIVSMPTARCIR